MHVGSTGRCSPPVLTILHTEGVQSVWQATKLGSLRGSGEGDKNVPFAVYCLETWNSFLLADGSTAAGHKAEPRVLEAAKPHVAKYCAQE